MHLEIKARDGLWMCMRPNRFANNLEYSIQRYGLSLIGPKIFNSLPLDVFRDEQGRVWTKSPPEQSESIFQKAMKNPNWYINISRKRERAYFSIKEELKNIQRELSDISQSLCNSPQQLSSYVSHFANLFSSFYTYVPLGLADDEFVDMFTVTYEKHLQPTTISKILNVVLRSEYAQNFNKSHFVMSEGKNIDLNIDTFVPVVEGEVNFNLHKNQELIQELKKISSPVFNDIPIHIRLVSISYQMGQENLFLGKPLITTFSYLLKKIVNISDAINLTKEKIFNYSYQEILFSLQNNQGVR